jgi:methyl-accepting chemotaxis protein
LPPFAVVADEVRQLAEEPRTAAGSIARLVGRVRVQR